MAKSKSMDFALSMTKYLFSKEEYKEKNLIFSPLSIQAALAVMAAGSDGRTLHEILSFLRFDSIDDLTTFFSQVVSPVFSYNDDHLSFVNGIWADQSLSVFDSFKQVVATHYKATLASLDFQQGRDEVVVREVNSWIEEQTNGLITHLLPPGTVTEFTKLIFANALYFQSTWKHKFNAASEETRFHLLNGTSVSVPFMNSRKVKRYIRVLDGFKILRLPYNKATDRKRRFSMCILLPDAKDGLSPLIQKLSSEPGFLKGKLPRRKVLVSSVSVPRFNISFTFEASNVLKEVGVVSPFSNSDADFTKMAEVNPPSDNKLYVESIFHKAFIAVNEQGTKATATAAAVIRKPLGGYNNPLEGINFKANRPFLFLIIEDFTGTILFVGQVLNPLDGAPRPMTIAERVYQLRLRLSRNCFNSVAATPVKQPDR